jgi:isocitrate dehydrogenase kinase/phosphatase
MNFKNYLEKLKNSVEYKNFKKENPDSFLSSAFFIIDLKSDGKENYQSFDFYIPKDKEMFSFCINDNFKKNKLDLINKNEVPFILDSNLDFDINKIIELLKKKNKEEKIGNSIHKILFSLQTKNKNSFLIGTVFLDKMSLVKFVIDIKKMKIISFDKKNIFEILKPFRK